MKVETREKTDFSDWLVASDIDGTLNNKLRRLPKRNYERICEFVLEKKGHFTLASGRNISSMRKPFKVFRSLLPLLCCLTARAFMTTSTKKCCAFTPSIPQVMSSCGR